MLEFNRQAAIEADTIGLSKTNAVPALASDFGCRIELAGRAR